MSKGQQLAIEQLQEIATCSSGMLEILGEPEEGNEASFIRFRLSLGTRHYKKPEGIAFRDRERLILIIYPDFPFTVPGLYFQHNRFVGAPHVQWGRSICLYQSAEVEWEPADGLFGFFNRVDKWFTAAGRGQLDPEDAPLHPPVAYTSSDTTFVIKVNAPRLAEGTSIWLGRAELLKVRDARFDVIGWSDISEWDNIKPKGSHIGAAIMLSKPLPMEYPSKINDLFDVLEKNGLSFDLLYQLLKLFALMAEAGSPAHFVLGAPMRRKEAGEDLKQHLTVWEVTAEALDSLRALALRLENNGEALAAVAKWMAHSSVQWCKVLENRPEIVIRRDVGSLSSELAGKRVLLFGCGALGAAIAEYVIRAGGKSLGLVDNGIVKPGILVRQHYSDADIGRAKACALRDRLTSIGLLCAVTAHSIDLKKSALKSFELAEWDLIIDATASASVSHKIENEVSEWKLSIPLIVVSVSAAAQHGSVAVKMADYMGGPIQITRQAKLKAFHRDITLPLVKAFWPRREEIKIFQPEPGCSTPTFIGSAADLDYHAAGLLNLGLSRIKSLSKDRASFDLVSAPWLEQKDSNRPLLRYEFEQYKPHVERKHAFQVLQSQVANQDIFAEISRISRTRSSKVETGGLIFGEIDDSHRYIWIDSVSGPPPDSEASSKKFLCGTAGTVDLANYKSQASGGSSRFVGLWHTHPVSLGYPSVDDLAAMARLLFLQPFPPRQVVMLIVGFSQTNPEFNYYLFHRNDFQIISRRSGSSEELADD
ncbi:MAG: ThiF family adenylyltransferase [Desulfobulbus sp.]|nr:ThiF family adenylyltransferase [Desulfobulbus sp.]